MKKVGAIIQARMSSTRLPGKVMKKVNGRSLLTYLSERLQAASSLKAIVVATSTSKKDDIIAEECRNLGVSCFRGSEQDVLDRFYQAAVKYDIDPIVRITADCPLLLPDLIDRAYSAFLEKEADYLGYLLPYPEGLADISVFPFFALKIAWQEACKPSEREHVVPFLFTRPERFNVIRLEVKSNLNHLRFTVDEKLDLQVVGYIINALYGKPKKIFGLKEIEKFANEHPEIVSINMHIPRNEGYQKSILEDKKWEETVSGEHNS